MLGKNLEHPLKHWVIRALVQIALAIEKRDLSRFREEREGKLWFKALEVKEWWWWEFHIALNRSNEKTLRYPFKIKWWFGKGITINGWDRWINKIEAK
jgi:hypothetical protein